MVGLLGAATDSAQAIGLTGASAAPVDPRAGAHSDFNLSFSVTNPGDNLRDLTVDLPTGVLGNPMATVRCAESDLNRDACPAESAVGTNTTTITAAGIPAPVPVSGTVYNVVPPADQPARLGIVLRPLPPLNLLLGNVYIIAKIRVRDDSDYGLQTIINDLPRTQSGLPIEIRSLALTLNGALPNGNSFMVNPTQCSPATTKITATSYASSKPVSTTASFTPTDCAGDPFQPGMEIAIESPTVDTPTPHAIGLTQPADVNGRQVSHVKKAVVRLPVGTTLNPSLAPTLELCSDAQFGPQGDPDVACPAASLVGHVAFDNPLLGTVPGDVYFGRSPGDPYRLLIIGRKSGVTVKIKASVQPDDDTGQITTVFDDLPQVPFTKFNLTFNGGPRGVVVTPPGCGTYTGSITATPWSGGPSQTPTASFGISDDGQGTCAPKETPAIGGKVSTTKALASPALDLDLSRDPGSRRPKKLDVTLPAGLLGQIYSMPMCPTSKATAGGCPASTQLGTVVTTIGSGSLPITLRGNVYLGTGTSTSIARLWLDIPVKVGPIDLGTFTLQNPLTLGRTDGRVHVSAVLPDAFKGFPVGLRRLQMSITKKDFLLNPSGCDARTFDVTATGVDGTSGSASGPFQASACDQLRFRPKVATSIEDPDVKAQGSQPPFTTQITKPPGDAALKDVSLLASVGLLPNPDALATGICAPEQLAADACPANARIGRATAVSPLLRDRLTGTVYLADIGSPAPDEPGVELPYLTVVLKGPGVAIRLDGQLRLSPEAGRLEVHFTNLPDVPLSSFRLDVDGGRPGKPGPFTASADLCATEYSPSDARLGSQADQQVQQLPVLDAAACRKGALVNADASGIASAKPRMAINIARTPSSAHALRSATVVLPAGLRGRPTRSGRGVVIRVDRKRLSRRHWTLSRSGTLTIRVPGKGGAQTIRVGLSRGAIVPTDGLRGQGRRRLSDLSGATPIKLSVSVYTRELKGKRARTTIGFDGRP
ncbi:MAG TPA: hypothetical protein VGO71_12125 [Baekduia sp.]|nr:hypothetical protein [Baekduia sp.]